MTTCSITTCSRTLHPDEQHRAACTRCEHRIRAWLREIPHQLVLLEASLERDRGPAQGTRHGGRAHSPLPLREDVLTLLGPAAPGPVQDPHGDQTGPAPILAVAHAWAEQLAEDLRQDLPPLRPGADYTRYLAAHLPYALTRPWIAEMHAELDDVVRRARAITHTHTHTRTHIYTVFANPHLICDLCRQPVPRWHNNDKCGCDQEFWNDPCGHTAGITSVCPSWSPVDGCQCQQHLGKVDHPPAPADTTQED